MIPVRCKHVNLINTACFAKSETKNLLNKFTRRAEVSKEVKCKIKTRDAVGKASTFVTAFLI